MPTVEIQQRLLAIAHAKGPLSVSLFNYELSAVCPSLFHDDGSKRTGTKSTLDIF